MSDWKPLAPEMKLGKYKVLFEGGSDGEAALTPRGWIIISESIFKPKDASIVAYKNLEKTGKWTKQIT